MSIGTKCVVLGAEGVGKTQFISRYLYNYLPTKYIPSKHPKISNYTFRFPPPGITIEITESIDLPETLNFSSVILVYDPLQPLTYDYVEKMITLIQDKIPRKIGMVIVALVQGHNKQGKGRALANKHKATFIVADLDNRNSIKRCFAICIS